LIRKQLKKYKHLNYLAFKLTVIYVRKQGTEYIIPELSLSCLAMRTATSHVNQETLKIFTSHTFIPLCHRKSFFGEIQQIAKNVFCVQNKTNERNISCMEKFKKFSILPLVIYAHYSLLWLTGKSSKFRYPATHVMCTGEGHAIAQRLDAGFTPRRPRLAYRQHVGFVVDKVALGQVFSEYFGFPCQSFHRFLRYHNHPGLTQ
jgi:hypothetical protein